MSETEDTMPAEAHFAPPEAIPEPGPEAERPPAARRTCIMVLGMHRSGTSALTYAISLLGAGLPKHLLAANAGNVTGYWEPERLVDLHDRMLAEAHSRWDDWRPLDLNNLTRKRRQFYRAEIARIVIEEFGQAPLFVLKEPRISRFVPLYVDILSSMGIDLRFVHTNRNPLAVADSLSARERSTTGFNALLWLRHELDAEEATRGRPRIFLSYEALLERPKPELAKIGDMLGIAWPRPVDDASADLELHLSPGHRHHRASAELLAADQRVPEWAKQTFTALEALQADPADPQALATLDAVRAALDASHSITEDFLFEELDTRTSILAETREAAATQLDELQRRVEGEEQRAAQAVSRAQALEQQMAAAAARLHTLESEAAESGLRLGEMRAVDLAAIEALRGSLAIEEQRAAQRATQSAGQVALMAQELAETTNRLQAAEAEAGTRAEAHALDLARLTDMLRLREGELDAQLAALTAERDQHQSHHAELEGEIVRLASANDAASLTLSELRLERDRLHAFLYERSGDPAGVSLPESPDLTAEFSNRVHRMEAEIAARDAEIEARDANLAAGQAQLEARDAQLEAGQAELTRAEQAHLDDIRSLSDAFRQKFEELIVREQELADQLAAERARTGETSAAGEALHAQIAGLDDELTRLRGQLRTREIEIDAVRQRGQQSVGQLQAHVHAILNSRSWRLLAPMRVAKTFWTTKIRAR